LGSLEEKGERGDYTALPLPLLLPLNLTLKIALILGLSSAVLCFDKLYYVLLPDIRIALCWRPNAATNTVSNLETGRAKKEKGKRNREKNRRGTLAYSGKGKGKK
jgi:hypothetical protein